MADFHPLPPPKDLHPSSASNYFGDDPPIPESVEDKLRYLFTYIAKYGFYLIQFWAPVDMDGRRLLTTSDQPFVSGLGIRGDTRFEEYRLCCVKYKYNIDVNKVGVEDDPTIICTGAQATAFLNHIPELVEYHQMTPLESSALQCGLMHSVVLPVFYPSQSCCVGVVEYSTSNLDQLLVDFNLLNVQLEIVGLKTFDARQRLPYKTICGLHNAKHEIDEALNIIWDTHGLPFAQVWIPCEDENQVAFSSSLQDTRTKRMLCWLKLTGHSFDNFNIQQVKCLEEYGTACYGLPLKMDKDFTGKTLENYEPHLINEISELNDNKPHRLRHFDFPCSCFVICLRSTKTRDLDYVFEFLWRHESRQNVILLESLLLTLERCLPSFKIASGAQVGDELSILDVKDSTESERKYFKIFQRNQLSPVSVTPKGGTQLKAKGKTEERNISRDEIVSNFGITQRKAAKKLKVSLSAFKRKCRKYDIFEWPKHGPKHILTIKVKYVDHDTFKFHLPASSATFEDIEKEINERFKLNPSDYKIKYRDEDDDWILLSSDKDMRVLSQQCRVAHCHSIEMEVLLRQIQDPKSLELNRHG